MSFEDVICIFVVLVIALMFGGLFFSSIANNQRIEEDKKKREKEEEKRIKEELEKERKIIENKKIDIACERAKHYGVDNLKQLLVERDSLYNTAVRNAVFSQTYRVFAPTYTKGAYKGSIGDVISDISNEKKKAKYEEDKNRKYQYASDARSSEFKLRQKIDEIKRTFEKLPKTNLVINEMMKIETERMDNMLKDFDK